MARGKTLLSLIDDLRAETRRSLNVAHNPQERAHQVQILQRTQERLWEDFAWPHLRVERFIPVQAGQRYYEPPEDVDIGRIEHLDIFLDGRWQPMTPNITDCDYGAHNSALDERAWPPRRWRIHEIEKIEVWPVPDINSTPATQDGYLRVVGIRNLKPLVDENDVADLDNRLITLYAAAEILQREGSKDANLKQANADRFFAKTRAGLTVTRSFQMFGVGRPAYNMRRWSPHYRTPV